MAGDGWRGAERVFDWSFYSQGTSETTTASADAFVAKALEFFGDPEMAQSAASPWDKGERLAHLVAEHKPLLVLDGVEPLQYPPGPVGGKLKDPALEALLKGLAQQNAGLCLVTTRESIENLSPWQDTTAPEWSLEHLSEEAGAQLLFEAGVNKSGNAEIKANDKELRDAAHEIGGHALTLQLLGQYLAKVHNGDVRKRSLVGFEKADARIQGGHSFRVMAAYETWLGGAGEEGTRQLAVLHLLGLFDRPADSGCLAALRSEPAITSLTEPLVGLDDEDWNYILSNLGECGLISVYADQSAIDCHPLVREYFGKLLREKNPDTWREAHRRLYEHLEQNTEQQPVTLAGLQPLYQAVAHGCLAGMYEEARARVYVDRILRGTDDTNGFYSARRLGAFGSDLAAMACFFEKPWVKVSPQLSEADKAWLLSVAAFDLRALGRLTEALEPMRAGLDMQVEQKSWDNAPRASNNLSELELTLGQVAEAVQDAERSVDYADRVADVFLRIVFRVTLADALFQEGKADKATKYFHEAEVMQAERITEYPMLTMLAGFRYCDLLLAPAERAAWQSFLQIEIQDSELENATAACRTVEQRAKGAQRAWREIFTNEPTLLDIALDHLSLGRVALYEAMLSKSGIRNAKSEIVEALDGLRTAGQSDELPKGLLSCGLLRFVEKNTDSCEADLDEAWQIAERGSMRLYMADVLLHRGRLFHDKTALAEAAKLIDECGYHRRDGELADAQEAAKNW